jgi:FkbM family methyltransferase
VGVPRAAQVDARAAVMKITELPHCQDALRPHLDKVLAGEYDLPPHLAWITPPETVLDIGANVGAFTAWARAKWREARIEAYEPVPENCETFYLNHGTDGNIALHCQALGAPCKEERFRLGKHNSGEGSLYDLSEQGDETIVLDVISPEDASASAEFIKIDAEGAEVEILQRINFAACKGLVYEWHGVARRDLCRREMERRSGLWLVGETNYGGERGIDVWVEPATTTHRSVELKRRANGMPHVYLSLPVYGGVDPWFHQSLMELVRTKDRPYGLTIRHHVGDSLVSRARNRLVAQFLKSEATHLLFIDTDLIFSPEHVARIVSHGEPIVAGLYPKKQRTLGWVCNLLDPSPEADERGLQPVKYAGTGFLCIAREVFEDLIEAYPEIRYDPDEGDGEVGSLWDFFKVGVWECPETGYRRYLSEDWWFCQLARDQGWEVLMDTQIICKHVGQFIYPFDSLETFATPVPEAGADAHHEN